jgi:replicative DNA helicase Mcm
MSQEVKDKLREFYVDMRQRGDGEITITARKLESLIRLAEASARVRLDNRVRAKDAEMAINVTKASMAQVAQDDEGNWDMDMVETGQSQSQRKRKRGLKEIIKGINEEKENDSGPATKEEIMEKAEEIGTDISKIEDEIERLLRQGELLEPKHGRYRVM